MRKLFFLAILIANVLAAPQGYTQDAIPVLIEPLNGALSIPTPDGIGSSQQPVAQKAILNMECLRNLNVGDRVMVSLGGVNAVIRTTNIVRRSNGVAWTGVPENYSSWDYILITTVGDYAFGTIQTGERTIKLKPSYATGIVDAQELNPAFEKPIGSDVMIPSLPTGSAPPQKDSTNTLKGVHILKSPSSESNYSTGSTTVDLMVYYTPGVVAYFGSEDAVRAGIQHLVDLTNQALLNSQISLQIRLVYCQQVSYPDDGSPSQALNDLTNATGVFSDMPSLRNRYGADLVMLMRRFNNATNDACGTAWLLPSTTQNWADAAAFSIVQIGQSVDGSPYYCSDFTFPHELGHNFGCQHDRAHASSPGIFNYSYGYIDPSGAWGTIMAYHSSRIPYFSNPNVFYNEAPTGVAPGLPNAADNALTISNTKDFVANYRSNSTGGGVGFETNGWLVNLSTRGYVGTGDNVMIAGFCVSAPLTMVIRALGPSLATRGVYGALADPMFEVYNSAGQLQFVANDWINDPSASLLIQLGIQPQSPLEAAAVVTATAPGCFTAVVRGVGGTTGVALIEVYDITLFIR